MRFLLDTHLVVATINLDLDSRFPRQALVIRDPSSISYVSVVSLWEIALKSRLGKLLLAVPLAELPGYLGSKGLRVLDLRPAHVLANLESVPATRDPFDRLLLAIAVVEGFRLLSDDEALKGHPAVARA
jgi:PIN domain nuclease of toxin-antitoxin system